MAWIGCRRVFGRRHPWAIDCHAMENEMVKRLMWSAVLAGCGALASILANRMAAMIWRQVFDEEPPE